jgi:hypothetical protein
MTTLDMFEFTKSGRIIAFMQAKSRKQARRRTQLVSHIVRIPEDSKIRVVERGTLCPPRYTQVHPLGHGRQNSRLHSMS